MANYNRVVLVGNITRTPETRSTQSGTSICKLGLAVNRKFKDTEETLFVDCTAFGKVGEIIQQYCDKGDPLLVEGRLSLSTWEDQNGNKRSKHEVVIENMQLMSGPKQGPESHGSRRSGGGAKQQADAAEPDYGDIPF